MDVSVITAGLYLTTRSVPDVSAPSVSSVAVTVNVEASVAEYVAVAGAERFSFAPGVGVAVGRAGSVIDVPCVQYGGGVGVGVIVFVGVVVGVDVGVFVTVGVFVIAGVNVGES